MPTRKTAPTRKPSLDWKGRTRRAAIPPTRDPFINSPMTRLTPDKNGAERFFISTYNPISGSIAACINEFGEHRLYHFDKPRVNGFYSVAQEDDDTLWLCFTIDKVIRFSLSTGKTEFFDTGAPSALVFQGMALDHTTGKLTAFAFPPPRTTGFVFDFRNKKPVKVVEPAQEAGKYMRRSHRNPDGTWTLVMHLPGEHLFIWDPRTDHFECITLAAHRETEDMSATSYMTIFDDEGRMYYPRIGWYDWRTRAIAADGPRPDTEMTWFGRAGDHAMGVTLQGATATLGRWDLRTGAVTLVATIPDCSIQNVTLTQSGKVVAVNLYGVFYRIDAATGALESSRKLDAAGVGHVDTLCLIDKDRLLGTPFITQRFWGLNLRTGKGEDLGRVAPGAGEIMKLTKVRDKVYMAAYTGGELVEYDPEQPSRFPENPRVVADPPVGMRPVAIANDGRHVYYTCSRDYGKLGSVLTRYDTRSGLAAYAHDPLGKQQINTMIYDKGSHSLICGSTIHADCQSAPPRDKVGRYARIDAATLEVIEQCGAPDGEEYAVVVGTMAKGQWLARSQGRWFILHQGAFATPTPADLQPWPVEKFDRILPTGKPGRFLLNTTRLEVWDLRKPRLLRVLPTPGGHLHQIVVQGDDVIYNTDREAFVLYDALKDV